MELDYVLFSRQQQGLPILITAAIVGESLRAAHPYCLSFTLPFSKREDGLPAGQELSRVSRLEDQVCEALTDANSSVIQVGHVTGNGVMRVFIYSDSAHQGLISVKTGLFKKEAIPIESRKDASWAVYELELEPTPMEREISTIQPVLDQLIKAGDVPSKPRVVDFAAKFPSHEKRSAFLEIVGEEGFTTTEKQLWEVAGQYWCELNKTTAVESETIAGHNAYLRQSAEGCGGEFDGWGCPIAT